MKTSLDIAIQQGVQPKEPRNGLGLVLGIPGARFRTPYDKSGLTPAGRYYYDKTGIAPPGKFDFRQDATRKGRSQYSKLLDGMQKEVSTWDNVNREWKLTKLGTQFYSKAVDRYTIAWPVRIQLARIQPGRYHGSIFEREDLDAKHNRRGAWRN